jgi:hypothetical protein
MDEQVESLDKLQRDAIEFISPRDYVVKVVIVSDDSFSSDHDPSPDDNEKAA